MPEGLKVLGASAASLSLVGIAIATRSAIDQRSRRVSVPAEQVVPAPGEVGAPPETPPVIVIPDLPLGGGSLRRGSMENDALSFTVAESLGVVCAADSVPRPGQQPARTARGAWPLQIADAPVLYDPNASDINEPLIFFGEETDDLRRDQRRLSRGIALGYDRLSGRYNLYVFGVGRSRDQRLLPIGIEGEAFSARVGSYSLAELTERPLRYDRIQIFFDTDRATSGQQTITAELTCAD